jgi:hypothetical protein
LAIVLSDPYEADKALRLLPRGLFVRRAKGRLEPVPMNVEDTIADEVAESDRGRANDPI